MNERERERERERECGVHVCVCVCLAVTNNRSGRTISVIIILYHILYGMWHAVYSS